MESEYIYHVTTLKEWEAAKLKNEYTPDNYEQDGFIHCSVEKQIPGVLDRFYKGQTLYEELANQLLSTLLYNRLTIVFFPVNIYTIL